MSVFLTILKSLPFLLPFLKELFMTDREGKIRHCFRVTIVGGMLLIGFALLGRSVYEYVIDVALENKVLNQTIAELKDQNRRLDQALDNSRSQVSRQHQQLNAYSTRYDVLREDFKDLRFEYDKLMLATVKGELTVKDIDNLKKHHKEIESKAKETLEGNPNTSIKPEPP